MEVFLKAPIQRGLHKTIKKLLWKGDFANPRGFIHINTHFNLFIQVLHEAPIEGRLSKAPRVLMISLQRVIFAKFLYREGSLKPLLDRGLCKAYTKKGLCKATKKRDLSSTPIQSGFCQAPMVNELCKVPRGFTYPYTEKPL